MWSLSLSQQNTTGWNVCLCTNKTITKQQQQQQQQQYYMEGYQMEEKLWKNGEKSMLFPTFILFSSIDLFFTFPSTKPDAHTQTHFQLQHSFIAILLLLLLLLIRRRHPSLKIYFSASWDQNTSHTSTAHTHTHTHAQSCWYTWRSPNIVLLSDKREIRKNLKKQKNRIFLFFHKHTPTHRHTHTL